LLLEEESRREETDAGREHCKKHFQQSNDHVT
jgi:hypothetical protein